MSSIENISSTGQRWGKGSAIPNFIGKLIPMNRILEEWIGAFLGTILVKRTFEIIFNKYKT
jgi:hypothetical protein